MQYAHTTKNLLRKIARKIAAQMIEHVKKLAAAIVKNVCVGCGWI